MSILGHFQVDQVVCQVAVLEVFNRTLAGHRDECFEDLQVRGAGGVAAANANNSINVSPGAYSNS